jgi:hypothetical protein
MTGRRPLVRCQCPVNATDLRACHRIATAEDFRCGICRIGCRRIWIGGSPGGHVPHASSPAALYLTTLAGGP